MNLEHRKDFRRKIGMAILDIQDEERKAGVKRDDYLAEVISALLSLAAFISDENAHITKREYLFGAKMAADDQWSNKGEDHVC